MNLRTPYAEMEEMPTKDRYKYMGEEPPCTLSKLKRIIHYMMSGELYRINNK